MTDYPPAVAELINALRQLPSVGTRSAERFALFLLNSRPAVSERLAEAITEARTRITPCPDCGFYSEDGDLCSICRDPRRESALWAVVEHPHDVLKLERSNSFKGRYHVLGGRLSPLDGVGPEDLSIDKLIERVRGEDGPDEVVLALAADVEGETTALYIVPLLKDAGVKVTRLATGLPAGGGLEFADAVTLGYALNGRVSL